MMGFINYLVEGGLYLRLSLESQVGRSTSACLLSDFHMFKMVFVRYLTVIWSISFLVFLLTKSVGEHGT